MASPWAASAQGMLLRLPDEPLPAEQSERQVRASAERIPSGSPTGVSRFVVVRDIMFVENELQVRGTGIPIFGKPNDRVSD